MEGKGLLDAQVTITTSDQQKKNGQAKIIRIKRLQRSRSKRTGGKSSGR